MRPTCLIGRAGIAMALGALLGIGHPRMAAGQELAQRPFQQVAPRFFFRR